MNLLEDDVEFVARYVRSIISSNGIGHLYVRPTGTVWVYKDGRARSKFCKDDSRVGVYAKGVRLDDLMDDLRVRLDEIKSPDMYQ